jgi:hypothetical protein
LIRRRRVGWLSEAKIAAISRARAGGKPGAGADARLAPGAAALSLCSLVTSTLPLIYERAFILGLWRRFVKNESGAGVSQGQGSSARRRTPFVAGTAQARQSLKQC